MNFEKILPTPADRMIGGIDGAIYQIQRDGQLWSVATDTRIMIGCQGVIADAQNPDLLLSNMLTAVFNQPFVPKPRLSVSYLRDWCGAAEYVSTCPDCDGGREVVEPYCERCLDEGEILPDDRWGIIENRHFSRNRIAVLLEAIGSTSDNDVLRLGVNESISKGVRIARLVLEGLAGVKSVPFRGILMFGLPPKAKDEWPELELKGGVP